MQIGSFVFKNTFFYLYWENDTATMNREVAGRVFPEFQRSEAFLRPYLLTQAKTRRTRKIYGNGVRSKYVVRPEAVGMCGNHQVWGHVAGKDMKLSESIRGYVID